MSIRRIAVLVAALSAPLPAVVLAQAPAQAQAQGQTPTQAPTPTPEPVQAAAASTVGEALAATVERDTTAGHAFTVPQGFVLRPADGLPLLQAPEGDGVLAEVQAGNADDALARAWSAYLRTAPSRRPFRSPASARQRLGRAACGGVRDRARRAAGATGTGAPRRGRLAGCVAGQRPRYLRAARRRLQSDAGKPAR